MFKSIYQHTVKAPLSLTGVGVHSGASATMTIKPAPSSSGIVFIRTDITDRSNVIPCRWDHVSDTRLCTVLSNKDGVSVSTVEHVLSSFAAMGVDNAVIEINGPEIPIMDSSAIAFIEALTKTGLNRQNAKRHALRIKKEITYKEGDKTVILSPADKAHYSFEIEFDTPLIGCQKFAHELDLNNYASEIASARTFGFLHEVEQLKKMGLARGGSLENAIVIDKDKVLNPGGLRYKNEFVRHKILDAIGDLYLTGMPLIGHYHGVKAGHALNNKLLHTLFSDAHAFEVVELGTEQRKKAPIPAHKIYGYTEQFIPALSV